MNVRKNKRGQVTIFIIVAIVIVVIGVLIFAFYPRMQSTSGFDVENPERFLQNCVEDKLKIFITDFSAHGLSLDPVNYAFYEREKLQYLCYTPNYDEACIRYPAFLIDTFEQKVSENLKSTIDGCFDSLEESYTSKNYDVISKKSLGRVETKILPREIKLELINYEITVSKEQSEKHNSFSILLYSNLYELLEVSSDILEDEVAFGEADKFQYVMNNLDLEITGPEYTDGTNIYIIKDKKTKEVFRFASRSLVPKPGI